MSEKEYTPDEINELEEFRKSVKCLHNDDFNFYADLSTASGCWTVIQGEAECVICGKRFKAVLEGSWDIDFNRVVENSTL
jgi:hypothetical protein